MAKQTDTEIHRNELLITLDYLVRHTDKKHPAKAVAICEYAKDEYGLEYDKKKDYQSKSSGDISRKRVGDVLKYLYGISEKHPYNFPFAIEQAEGGKYYVSNKYGFDDEDISKILAAIRNDKYTSNNETFELYEKLLDAFSSEYTRDSIEKGAKNLDRGVKKYKYNKALQLVKKAHNEKALLRIKKQTFLISSDYYYCYVYDIRELNNKPNAILVPTNGDDHPFIIPVNEISFPDVPESELVVKDDEKGDRIKEAFERNKYLVDIYGNIDNYIKERLLVRKNMKVSFYFSYNNYQRIKNSFESNFDTELEVIKASKFKINEDIANYNYKNKLNRNLTQKIRNEYAITDIVSPRNNDDFAYGVVNMELNPYDVEHWLMSNPNISRLITIVAPYRIKSELANELFHGAFQFVDSLNPMSTRYLEFGKLEEKYNQCLNKLLMDSKYVDQEEVKKLQELEKEIVAQRYKLLEMRRKSLQKERKEMFESGRISEHYKKFANYSLFDFDEND